MATRKLNARSPYFITSSGTVTSSETGEVVIEDENILLSLKIVQVNSDGTTNDVLGSGISEQNITLRASGNFTPANNVYTWTASSGTSLGTSVDATFTEDISTITPSVTQKQFFYTVSAETSDGDVVTSPPFYVNWRDSSITSYIAKLTIDNEIEPSYSSPGYDLSITFNATNQNAITQSTSDGTLGKAKEIIKEVTGETGDSYSFSITLTKKDGFTDTASPLSVSTSSFSGTFASADVDLSSTLSGTVVRDATYILSSNTNVTTEGCPFTITLSTTNIPDNSSVPFTISGIAAEDLERGNLSGAFQIKDNVGEIEFEAVSDAVSEQPKETFTLSLTGISNTSPNVSQVSVDIYDNITSGTANEINVSTIGRDTANQSCEDTASEKAYYRLLPGQDSFGDGVFLFSNQGLTVPYKSDGKYYKIGSNYNARIGVVCGGKITNYAQCGSQTGNTGGTIFDPEDTIKAILISGGTNEDIGYRTNPGPGGSNVCNLPADKTVYYEGQLTSGTILYENRDTNDNLSNPFGGTGNWYKIVIPNVDGDLISHYGTIDNEPPGYVSNITECGVNPGDDDITTGAGTGTPSVIIEMATEDGNNQGRAYASQRVSLLAIPTNISNPTYQWQKGTTQGSLSDISGQTSQRLLINGGTGETQTTTTDPNAIYYNCKVSGTGVSNITASTDKPIIWETRPSFSNIRYVSGGSSANINACTSGTDTTIYTNRAGATSFCNDNQIVIFYTDPTATTPAPQGTYSDSTTGTNNNFRYIAGANGIAQGCINGGCSGPPAQSITNVSKIAAKRCTGQNSENTTSYFQLNNFEYYQNKVIRIKDVGQQGGEGCYTVQTIYDDNFTLPSPYFVLESTDILNSGQAYGSCADCVGNVVVEEEIIIDEEEYYGAYRLCGSTGDTLLYVVSDSDLPNVLRPGTDTTKCRHIVYELHGSQGQIAAYNPDALLLSGLNWEEFNNCEDCIEDGSQPVATGLQSFHTYEKCTDSSITFVFGHPDSISASDFASTFPTVAYNGECWTESATTSTTTTVNIQDLAVYRDCDTCDVALNPPPPEEDPTPVDIKTIRISRNTRTTETDACMELNTFGQIIYYTGNFEDGTYLYRDDTLSTLYTTTSSNNFHKTETGIVFSIGRAGSYGDPSPEGQIYDVILCSSEQTPIYQDIL
jgi:hypothetical protein